ncbi:unnamed protein product [Mytilus edulis]|uniref:Uncharacterized protein n=1 Tax=Mytilus edulis TaxID=6550 RepID=A0A8S3QCY7_MYTED|nr:unnamed protein product [Mytilus edulis]
MEKDRLLKAIVKREIKLVKLLIDGGVDVKCRGYDGKTPLLVACSFVPEDKDSDSLLSLVGRLIRGGANPNVQDPLGRTPLICKSYVRTSFVEYNPIPEEYENERKASRSCNELCLRGCQTHQLYRDIQKKLLLKRKHKQNTGCDNTNNSIVSKKDPSEETVDRTINSAFEYMTCKDISNSSSQRKGNPLSSVSEIDKDMVVSCTKHSHTTLPPIP